MQLTPEEQKAIKALKALEKIWPKTLWLFATGMSISIMRAGADGRHIVCEGNKDGGMNPEYIVGSVDIPNDGGDW